MSAFGRSLGVLIIGRGLACAMAGEPLLQRQNFSGAENLLFQPLQLPV
jgi:hypothetical protein